MVAAFAASAVVAATCSCTFVGSAPDNPTAETAGLDNGDEELVTPSTITASLTHERFPAPRSSTAASGVCSAAQRVQDIQQLLLAAARRFPRLHTLLVLQARAGCETSVVDMASAHPGPHNAASPASDASHDPTAPTFGTCGLRPHEILGVQADACRRLLASLLRVRTSADIAALDAITAASTGLRPLPPDERKQQLALRLAALNASFPSDGILLPTLTPEAPRVRAIVPSAAIALKSHAKVPILVRFRFSLPSPEIFPRPPPTGRTRASSASAAGPHQSGKRARRPLHVALPPRLNSAALAPHADSDPPAPSGLPATAAAIFKVGDDVRQDALALQVIELAHRASLASGAGCYLLPYRAVPLRRDDGMLQVIERARSRDEVGALVDGSLFDFYVSQFGPVGTPGFEAARKNFARSAAGYAVATYLLAVKDRHNGNIMLDHRGRQVHIDFGFILGLSPAKNTGFEMAPFKLTREMLQLLSWPAGLSGALEFSRAFPSLPTGAVAVAAGHSPAARLFAAVFFRTLAAASQASSARSALSMASALLGAGLPCFARELRGRSKHALRLSREATRAAGRSFPSQTQAPACSAHCAPDAIVDALISVLGRGVGLTAEEMGLVPLFADSTSVAVFSHLVEADAAVGAEVGNLDATNQLHASISGVSSANMAFALEATLLLSPRVSGVLDGFAARLDPTASPFDRFSSAHELVGAAASSLSTGIYDQWQAIENAIEF
jgi:hypothetical protein